VGDHLGEASGDADSDGLRERPHRQVQIATWQQPFLNDWKYGHPPDKQEKATQTVYEQAKLLCKDWAA
jgi:hypothetical protein